MSAQPSCRPDFSSTPAPVEPPAVEWGGRGTRKAVAAARKHVDASLGPRVRRVSAAHTLAGKKTKKNSPSPRHTRVW